MKKIVINFGNGSLRRGCDTIIAHCLDAEQKHERQIIGSLPPAAELSDLHRRWQSLYQAAYQDRSMRISFNRSGGAVRYSEAEFDLVCRELSLKFNEWLSSSKFSSIEHSLRTNLHSDETIQIILIVEDERLRQFPWHLWNFLNDYPKSEISLSSLNWQKQTSAISGTDRVRILAVVGNNKGIDFKADLDALQNLPNKELVVLYEPKLQDLNEVLWQPAGWDILFFSGHSETKLEEGRIFLNAYESITIDRFKNSLNRAIANGLKIAIFNSCEGIGLALKLANLSISYTVVMREQIPDKIAQIFLKDFLTAFARGKYFTLAVREAREKLQGWENEYSCASWLPMIWQNPAATPLIWQDLQGAKALTEKQSKPQLKGTKYSSWGKTAILASFLASSLTMGLRSLGVLESGELATYDTLLRQRPLETLDSRILTIEITEEDLQSDRYPLRDTVLIDLIDRLEKHQPAAIGLDLHRAYPRGKGNKALQQRFNNIPYLFTVCSYGSKDSNYAPPPGMSREQLTYQMGFSDLPVDSSNWGNLEQPSQNAVRRQILSYDPNLAPTPSQCLAPYSLSFRLAYQYLHQRSVEPLEVNQKLQWQLGKVEFSQLTSKFSGYQNLDGQSSQIPLNYRAGQPSQKITLKQLLARTSQSNLIKDRIVLIGYSAPVARDESLTPYGKMPNVLIHAHMTSQIISAVLDGRSLIWTLPQRQDIQWGDWLWVFVTSAIASSIISISFEKHLLYGVLSFLVLFLLLHQICLFFLIKGGWLPYIPSIVSILITLGIMTIYRQKLVRANAI